MDILGVPVTHPYTSSLATFEKKSRYKIQTAARNRNQA
jgi:hypothetical protein